MNYFGGGITYTSDTTVLVTGQFSHVFETKLVLEYDIHSGQYTGRTAVLNQPDGINASTLLAVGIDDGLLDTTPVLFTYDVSKDSIYAIPYDLRPAAAPVRGIAPACDVQADGRVRLAWTNSPDMAYDTIRIRLNGSIVETLPGGATEYTTPQPVAGKFLFCVETLTSPEENVVQACCEGEDLRTPAFLPAGDSGVSRVYVDPSGNHFQTGITSPPVVKTKEDFRLHVVGSYDNAVRVTDYKRVRQPVDLATSPAIRSMVSGNYIVNFAATGIALMDIPVGGTTIPMYMIYDNDGPTGNSVSSASLHFLRDTVLPGGATVTPAGSLYREEITAIDFSAIDTEGIEIIGWDTDPAGDLIAVERQRERLIKLHYDPLVHTLKATAEAPLPIKDLTPFTNANFPLGGITVLPSGFYLLAGGDIFDTTITRVFLLTPMGPGPQASVQLVGAENGLRTLGLITGFGRMVGPPASYGLESGFIRGEGQGAGVLFLNTLHYFPTPGTGFQGNLLVEMDCPLAHPDLVAEALVDQSSTAGAPGFVDTGDLQPAFGSQVKTTDYHYQILNPSKYSSLRIRVRVILDGEEVLDFVDQDVTIPPGRRLYRVARNRPEKAFNVRVENLGQASQIVRILAGATALKSAAPVEHFRRGDVDGNALVQLTDAIYLLTWLYLSGPEPPCPDASDSDDNGILELTDAIYSLTWLFLSGTPMPSPGPTACGPDTQEDSLGPCSSSGCP